MFSVGSCSLGALCRAPHLELRPRYKCTECDAQLHNIYCGVPHEDDDTKLRCPDCHRSARLQMPPIPGQVTVPTVTQHTPPRPVAMAPLCKARGCKSHVKAFPCDRTGCEGVRCLPCVNKFYDKNPTKTKLTQPGYDGEKLPVVFCNQKCYKSLYSTLGYNKEDGLSKKINWDRDGAAGPSDPNHSESILLHWLLEEGNYAKYRGGEKNGGTRKGTYCDQIAAIINEAGVRCPRNSKDVSNKIQYFEERFRQAHEFATSETGAGIQERDIANGTTEFSVAVRKYCRHYEELAPIMADRASAKPAFESDMLDNDDDDNSVDLLAHSNVDNNREPDTSDESGQKRKPSKQKLSTEKKKSRAVKTVFDPNAFVMLRERTKKAELEETTRHNQKVEELKEKSEAIEREQASLQLQRTRFKYRLERFKEYQSMKEIGMSGSAIIEMFPEMKEFVPHSELPSKPSASLDDDESVSV